MNLKKILFYFIFFNFKARCCSYCNYNKDNNNLNLDNNNNSNNKNNDQQDKPIDPVKDREKEDKEEVDIYSKDNGTSPFKWYDVNCTLKSTITEFNNLCNYIPEIIERIKDENNIIKDSIDINIKKKIINEILNQRQQYLELKRCIDVNKLLDLIIEYIEITIKTIPIEDLYLQKYKDLIYLFDIMFGWTSFIYNNLKKYLDPIYYFAEIDNEQDNDTKKTELEKFLKIRNNIDLKKNDNSTRIKLFQFLIFIDNYIVKFIDKKEKQIYHINNKKFKIYTNTNDCKNCINNNINNIISINLVGRYSSTLSHSISIQKYKNNYYFDSYNYYCNVSKDDITNYNFAKMFENHGKLTYKNTFENVDYIVAMF